MPAKIVFSLMHLTKGNAKTTVLMFMIATGVVSAFVSNLPCAALFAGIAMSNVIELEQKNAGADTKHTKNLGKALMIGIPYAAIMGGMITPAGSALNIMTINMLRNATDGVASIAFLDWVIMCAPIAIVLLFVAWASVVLVFKTDRISDATVAAIRESGASIGKLDAFDWKALVIILGMIAAWIASNWTGWDATAIAVIGMALFFLPGHRRAQLEGVRLQRAVEHRAAHRLRAVHRRRHQAARAPRPGCSAPPLASWARRPGALDRRDVAVVHAASAPHRPGGPGASSPSASSRWPAWPRRMGASAGHVFAIIIAYNANASFLLGVDSSNMMTYKYGQWTMKDFVVAGIIPTVAMVLLHTFALAPLVAMVGY